MYKNERNQENRLFQAATHTHEHGRPASALGANGPARKSKGIRHRRPGFPADIVTRTSLLF